MGKTFAALLRQHRLTAGLTQEALAERSGLSVPAIGALERGVRRHPYPSTVDLLARALDLSPGQRDELAAAAAAPRTAAEPRTGWTPAPATPLIGREPELRRASELLRQPQVRLLTLTGGPGAGKTRLGLAVTTELEAEFRRRVFLVPLADLTDPDAVWPAIGGALGVHDEAPDDELLERVGSHLGGRRALVLLDGFEHLLPARGAVPALLARCAGLHVLVTSRWPLGLRGEHVLPVPPLPLPDRESGSASVVAAAPSAALLLQRAEAAGTGFQLTAGNAPDVAQVCRLLNGVPLALELAAPWLGPLPAGALVHRLGASVPGPAGAADASDEDPVRLTLALVREHLTDGERTLFRRLCVFAGGAGVEAVAAVCQAAGPLPARPLDLLAGLVDRGLAQCRAEGGELRLRMPSPVRAYGRELLAADAAEAAATERAHALRHLELAAVAERGLTSGEGQRDWLDRLDREHDNLRAALAWARDNGETAIGLELAASLWRYWGRRGHAREGLAWLRELLARHGTGTEDPRLRARALNACGNLAGRVDPASRSACYLACLDLYRAAGDRDGEARALNNLGRVAIEDGDHRAASARFEESLAIFRELGDPQAVAVSLANLGQCAMELGDLRRSAAVLAMANEIRCRLDDALGLARSLLGESVVLARLGEANRAEALMEESLRLCRELGDEATLAHGLARRADAALAAGRPERARADYVEGLVTARRVGPSHVVLRCVEGLAALAAADGGPDVANRLRAAAAAVRGRSGPTAPTLDEAAAEALAWAGSRPPLI
jgi:predicted ATPase